MEKFEKLRAFLPRRSVPVYTGRKEWIPYKLAKVPANEVNIIMLVSMLLKFTVSSVRLLYNKKGEIEAFRNDLAPNTKIASK